MARLPQPGSDEGTWGEILNEYLSRALSSDGTIKQNAVGATQLADNAVTATSIAPGAVTTAEIQNGSISEAKLDNSVQTKLNAATGLTDLGTSATATTVTISSSSGADTAIGGATGSVAGVLIAADKTKLDGIASGAQANSITSVAGKTGAVTLVKGDVGLGNVDNTSDENKPISSAAQAELDTKLNKVTERGDSDIEPVWQTNFTGTIDTEDRNVAEHYVNGTMTAWLNEWGAMRGSAPFQDALFRAIRTNTDGAGSGNSPAFHLNDRRTGALSPHIWARTWNGALLRNGITMADTYVRNSSSDPIPPGLPAGTIVITLS